MKDLWTIGEMAKLFQTSTKTLRYYDDIDLLKPSYIDPQNNYRYYSTHEFEKLNYIKYLRSLDISIQDIKEFYNHKTTSQLVELFSHQEELIEQKIQTFIQMKQKVHRRKNALKNFLNSHLGKIQECQLPERQIFMLSKKIAVGEDFEYDLRTLNLKHNMESVMFLGKVGLSFTQDDFINHRFQTFSKLFIFIEKEDRFSGEIETLKGGDYLTLRFQGTHLQSSPYYLQLHDYLSSHHYHIQGDPIEIALIDSGMIADEKEYMTEIQILIQK